MEMIIVEPVTDRDHLFAELGAIRGQTYAGPSMRGSSKHRSFYCDPKKHLNDIGMSSLKYSETPMECRYCIQELRCENAARRGITFVDLPPDVEAKANYSYYMCSAGKHFGFIHNASLKEDGTYTCKECVEEALIEGLKMIAVKRDLEFLRRDKKSKLHSWYKCKSGHELRIKNRAMLADRDSEYNCPDCVEERNREDAQRRSLTYVGKYKGGKAKRYYRCKSGHALYLYPSSVEGASFGPYSCRYCRFEQIEKQSSLRGLIPLFIAEDQFGSSFYRPFRKAKCGHELEIHLSNLFQFEHEYSCCTCIEIKRVKIAASVGLIYHRKSEENDGHEYLTPCCSKLVCLQDQQVKGYKTSRYQCSECKENELIRIAEYGGLAYLGFAENDKHGYRNYRLPCGCEKSIRNERVYSDTWFCEKCDDYTWSRESNVYAVKVAWGNLSFLKVGHAEIIEERVKLYGLACGATWKIIHSQRVSSRREALQVENFIHSHASIEKFKVDGENANQYFTKSGFTECYYPEALQCFFKIIEEVL